MLGLQIRAKPLFSDSESVGITFIAYMSNSYGNLKNVDKAPVLKG